MFRVHSFYFVILIKITKLIKISKKKQDKEESDVVKSLKVRSNGVNIPSVLFFSFSNATFKFGFLIQALLFSP